MRIGIVGLGFRLGYLAQLIALRVPGAHFAGYVDPAPAGMPRVKNAGIDPGPSYPDLETMLDSANLDLLMIGSPNHLHLDHIRDGLDARHEDLRRKAGGRQRGRDLRPARAARATTAIPTM